MFQADTSQLCYNVFMNQDRLCSLEVTSAWLKLWLIIDEQDRVSQVSLQPPTEELTELKSHHYHQLVKSYLDGELTAIDQIKVSLPKGEFRQAILSQMRQVPAGQTISYSQLAERSGYPRAARAVGSVCKHNPLPLIIPRHRVTKSDGSLGQYAFGADLKRRLLRHEGISF